MQRGLGKMISDSLNESFRQLLVCFHSTPARALSRWVTVSDDVGEDMIYLLVNLIDRKLTILIGDRVQYQEVRKLVSMHPWSELLALTEDGRSVKLNNSVNEEDWELLRSIMSEYLVAAPS